MKVGSYIGNPSNSIQVTKSAMYLLLTGGGSIDAMKLSVDLVLRNTNQRLPIMTDVPVPFLAKVATRKEGFYLSGGEDEDFSVPVLLGAQAAVELSNDVYLDVKVSGVLDNQPINLYAVEAKVTRKAVYRYTQNAVLNGEPSRQFVPASAFAGYFNRSDVTLIRLFYANGSVVEYDKSELAMLERLENDICSMTGDIVEFGLGGIVEIGFVGVAGQQDVVRYEVLKPLDKSIMFYTIDLLGY